MLIYIHVPFCRTKCNYCAFQSIPLGKADKMSAAGQLQNYLDTLLMEIAHSGDEFHGQTVQSVFFGGGTPSILPPAIIGTIMERISNTFKLAPKPEITMEANPESLKGHNAADYLASGINRLSIGLQSLDDGLLRALGRPHKAIDGMNAIYAARAAGFSNISVDLMWALPGQGVRQWLQTLKDVVRLGPDHISAYNLTLEPGTALEEEFEKGKLVIAPERDQSIMYMEGAAFLEANGFLHYEVSNFARMGFQCRHNLGYWEGAEYLGLGPSSTSTIGNRRWTNPGQINAWQEQVKKGPTGRGIEILTPKIRILELVMLRLRTARGLRLKAYRDLTGRDFLQDHQKLIQTMHENGLVRIRNGYMSLTRSGMLVSNTILANIFERIEGDSSFNPDKLPRTPTQPPISLKETPEARPVIWPQADTARKRNWSED